MPETFYKFSPACASGVKREIKYFAYLRCSKVSQSFQWMACRAWSQRRAGVGRAGVGLLPCCVAAVLSDGRLVCRAVQQYSVTTWLCRFSFLNVSSVKTAGHFLDIVGKIRGRVWLSCWSDWCSQLLWSWLVASYSGKLQWASWKYRKHKDMEEADNGQVSWMAYVKRQEEIHVLKTQHSLP